jgi:hypothetical protein
LLRSMAMISNITVKKQKHLFLSSIKRPRNCNKGICIYTWIRRTDKKIENIIVECISTLLNESNT